MYKFSILTIAFLLITFALQKLATNPHVNGIFAFLPYVLFISMIILLIVNFKKIGKWLSIVSLFVLLCTSCNTIESDKIGVRVENFGKSPEDYSLVYGRFPTDWSQSSWNLTYPGQSLNVPVEGFNVYSKDGVSFWSDPSVLCELIRTNEACRKYAFKFSAYKEKQAFETAVQQLIVKETLDAVRSAFNGSVSDSIIFNRGKYESLIQNQLQKGLAEKYGINLSQFSITIAPPEQLQKAINDRLLAQEETKKTLASLENANAKIKLAEIEQKRMTIESQGLTPSVLKKYEMELNYNAWIQMAHNQNAVYISGTPTNFIVGNK